MEIDEINFILRGSRRRKILKKLENISGKNISYISKELKLSITNVSKTIKELEKNNYVICENPKKYHYKMYKLTKKGKSVLFEIKKFDD